MLRGTLNMLIKIRHSLGFCISLPAGGMAFAAQPVVCPV